MTYRMRKWGDGFLVRLTRRMGGPPRRLGLGGVAAELLHGGRGRGRRKRLRLALGRPGRRRLDAAEVVVVMVVDALQLIHRTGRHKGADLPDGRRRVRSPREIRILQNLLLVGVERTRSGRGAETGRRAERVIHPAFAVGAQQPQFRHFIHRSRRRRTRHPVTSVGCHRHQIVVDGRRLDGGRSRWALRGGRMG